MPTEHNLRAILDLARWAPSGDNTQPWRFEVVDAHHVVVHGFDTRGHCVYDLDGHASELSLGTLLETMAIAASGQGLAMQARRRSEAPTGRPTFELRFTPDAGVRPDPLLGSIERRSVQRRAMSTRRLTAQEKRALEAAVAPHGRVLWREDFSQRLAMARLLSAIAKVRLSMPEAYRVHRDIIEWKARFSIDRVPDQALGVDAVTARLMRFVLGSWERVRFFNRYLAGTAAPRLQMDLLPGVACAAHFVLLASREPRTIDDHVAAGRAVQRFWLTATHLGLNLQPATTPLIFGRYLREQRPFTTQPGLEAETARAVQRLETLLGPQALRQAVFMGRVGAGPAARSRSLRLPLQQLEVVRAQPSGSAREQRPLSRAG
ncbi:nitroreductase family protein [Azohydromonas caseinilytica]|uniref:Molybdopterin biosynthesis protein MoeY n=1 Tax=Azohydromonas caseinilytica TaxID=2728836 RepID=A0A848F6A8_9BURK|nr:nitroreductase family protein [Azohydromonas caseinilytica]NML14225.1 molybdopterin biosynthesis protein MoeY [Azohydromonas caseinilytica]